MNVNHAMIAAFERSKKREEGRDVLRAFTMLLVAVFFIVLMGCLAVGASLYGDIAAVREHANAVHLQSGFLANVVHAGDVSGALREAEGPEGRALVLVEELETGTYETRIYSYRGTLYQEYAIAGRPFNPSSAVPIFDTSTFDFDVEGDLLTMRTDQGSACVALRTSQQGLQGLRDMQDALERRQAPDETRSQEGRRA